MLVRIKHNFFIPARCLVKDSFMVRMCATERQGIDESFVVHSGLIIVEWAADIRAQVL